MKIVTLAAVSALALAAPAFSQMQPGPADPNHGGRGSMNSQPMNGQPMDRYQGDDMGRGQNDPAMSGRGSGMDHGQMGDDRGHGMDHMGGEHDMARNRADHAGGYGRHCRTVWHHHHRVRRCY